MVNWSLWPRCAPRDPGVLWTKIKLESIFLMLSGNIFIFGMNNGHDWDMIGTLEWLLLNFDTVLTCTTSDHHRLPYNVPQIWWLLNWEVPWWNTWGEFLPCLLRVFCLFPRVFAFVSFWKSWLICTYMDMNFRTLWRKLLHLHVFTSYF